MRALLPLARRRAVGIALGCLVLAPLRAQLDWVDKPLLNGSRHEIAYDSARRRAVLFGGQSPLGALAETWEWDGDCWTLREPTNRPTGRSLHALAYDSDRRRVVLFGGSESGTGALTDTWEWDGRDWSQIPTTSSPPPQRGHEMAYDAARRRVVLFGGGETWEWDGTRWSRLMPADSPSDRIGHGMAYDPVRRRVVLFGGEAFVGASATWYADTWEWDGVNWTRRSIGVGPPARSFSAMCFEASSRRILMFGGSGGSAGLRTDTWEWDGTRWTERFPAESADASVGAMVYDLDRGRAVLLGSPFDFEPATWEWDGNVWSQRVPVAVPSPRYDTAMAYDDSRGRLVLFGGIEIGQRGETWEWDGQRWSRKQPPSGPLARGQHAMAYDRSRRRTVLFGGDFGSAETWEWDGTSWASPLPTLVPPGRTDHAMAYDEMTRRVLMFGGRSSTGVVLDDTWAWDGTTWVEVSPGAGGPAGRTNHAMATDRSRRRIVLHGGFISARSSGDTWEWDGSSWAQIGTASPGPRSSHAMATGAGGQGVILVGGFDDSGIRDDTWRWDGSKWTPAATTRRPPPVHRHALAYDSTRDRHVLFAGLLAGIGSSVPPHVWLLGPTTPARTTVLGTGCTGSHGTPRINAFGRPTLGNGCFAVDLTDARPAVPAVLLISPLSGYRPLGPCTLWVDPGAALAVPVAVNTSGFAAVGLPVPRAPALIGGTVASQALTLDPSSPIGFALSNGLSLRVGE